MKHKRVAALLASSLRVAMTKKSPKSMFINVYTFSLTFSWLPFKENICYRAYENHIKKGGFFMTDYKENELDKETTKKDDDSNYIFRPYITTKDGRKLFAKDYGLKAFKIKL